ncbi:MAG TPA: endo alpha-1,4 polygalactosaminidase, partial [Candidatus Nanoarchaeia archaeon]|nr:endo alpha-1,4 polygalactosaminidase [Candidatus Nanoarchaeia archaeon]
YWDKRWKDMFFSSHQGFEPLLKQIMDKGFDGIYIDGTAAYLDDGIFNRAYAEEKDPRQEMVNFVQEIRAYTTSLNPNFIIVSQNPGELLQQDEFAILLDGVAQEHVWFDGGISGKPNGDCPLPRKISDIVSQTYRNSLKDACLDLYEDFPESNLHIASEEYLVNLNLAKEKGLKVFTVDYAEKTINILNATNESRSRGFIPLVTVKNLDVFIEPR